MKLTGSAHPLAVALAALLTLSHLPAQETLADLLEQPGVDLSDPASRQRVVDRMREITTRQRQAARAEAQRRGLPVRLTRPNGAVQEIARFDGDRPVYFTTDNANAAISTGADQVRSTYGIDGSGTVIGLWDGGSARATHQEFGGRVSVMDGAGSIDHATHVGGTMIASGVVSSAKGMAPAATIDSYDWNSDVAEMTARGATGPNQAGSIYLSNHSYGFITGWNYTGNPSRLWEWWGNGTDASGYEQDFGRYNTDSRDQDALAYAAPYYLIFRSAGNDRADNPSAGDPVGLSASSPFVYSYDPATFPPGDGVYRGGYETISFAEVAKNVLTVGSAADAVTGGSRDPSKANVSWYSCWGPTDDGRIKPDLVANGEYLYSSLNGSDSTYGTYSGTSMACPNATGSAALLIKHYGNLFPGGSMLSSTLKALLIHTADDRGNPGPDYKYGWGMMNAKAAADLISAHAAAPDRQQITEAQLTTASSIRTHPFAWDGVSPIRATLCWTDPAASSTTTSDLRSPRLVNNLELKLIAPGGAEYLPYVMPFVGTWTQASMGLTATTGANSTDNVEQVWLPSPGLAGTWQAVVSVTGPLTNDLQDYSLILTGAADVPPPPAPLTINSASPDRGYSGTVIVDLTGAGFQAGTAVKLALAGESDITASSVQLIGESLRCQFNITGAAAGDWDLVATNPDLESTTLAAAFTVIDAHWSENFDGTVSGWTSASSTGGIVWSQVTATSHTPTTSYFVPASPVKDTASLVSPPIPIPPDATNLQFSFWHSFDLESGREGGRLELSVDGGTWFDVGSNGSAFASNGYNSSIGSGGGPPSSRSEFAGQDVWSGDSGGFIQTLVNLTDPATYAGHSLQLRWRLGTNDSGSNPGWHVDSMALVGDGNFANMAPTIVTAASSSSIETVTDPDTTVYEVLRGSSTTFSVTADDDAGEPALTYTWSSSGPGAVFFQTNGSNAAKTAVADFEATGDYVISVAVEDAEGLTTPSTVNIRVLETASGLAVTPAVVSLTYGDTQAFSATLLDQFGSPMSTQPPSFSWSATGGSVDGSGLFSATAAGGPFVVDATSDAFTDSASVTVLPMTATVTLGSLAQTYDGTDRIATATTNPPSLPVSILYDSSPTPPSDAGSYAVVATITDPNYQGSASDTLVVSQATATITLGSLSQTYDGTERTVTATTSPPDLAVSLLYDSSPTAPTDAGSYAVAAAIADPNYQGSANGTLVVDKATATVTLSDLTQGFDGTPKSATVTTDPSGLPVDVTYDASPDIPTDIGSYAVLATVNDPNYDGSETGTLEIAGQTYNSWRDLTFSPEQILAGDGDPGANPDFDSYDNFGEYALNTDPLHFTPPLPFTHDASFLTLDFERPLDRTDVSYHADSTPDLSGWTEVPLQVIGGTATTETLRAQVPLAGESTMLLRLRFE